MRLGTTLGWKYVSLHNNLDALEITFKTHQKQSLEETQAELTAPQATYCPVSLWFAPSPPNPVG